MNYGLSLKLKLKLARK